MEIPYYWGVHLGIVKCFPTLYLTNAFTREASNWDVTPGFETQFTRIFQILPFSKDFTNL